jgi:hypothetical protein
MQSAAKRWSLAYRHMVHKTIILQDYGLLYPWRRLISATLHKAAVQKINVTATDTAGIDEKIMAIGDYWQIECSMLSGDCRPKCDMLIGDNLIEFSIAISECRIYSHTAIGDYRWIVCCMDNGDCRLYCSKATGECRLEFSKAVGDYWQSLVRLLASVDCNSLCLLATAEE